MSGNDIKLMERALEIGFSRLGKTSPNPPVGAVIVKNGEIISTGGTSAYGSDHAEVVAIKSAGQSVSGADMYVSLEPCCHTTKKTPPCTEAIKKAGISRVFIPVLDPNPAVAGKGVQALKEAGIDVIIMSEMAQKAFDLIRHFNKYIIKKSPYVIHKSAITLDGRIASISGDSKWISSDYSRYITHKLRSLVDAIVIGKNTFIKDNPELSVRLDSFQEEVKEYFKKGYFNVYGKESFFIENLLSSVREESASSPLRVVMGNPGRFDYAGRIFMDDNYIFFVNEASKDSMKDKSGKEEIGSMVESGKLVFIKGHTRVEQVRSVLDELYNRGKMMIMLEGGGTIAGSFLDAGEIDQFMYFISPKILGKGIDVMEAEPRMSIPEAYNLHDVSAVLLKDDILYNAYSEPVLGLCEESECLQD